MATTRLMTDEAAARAGGFYSQGEFDLEKLAVVLGDLQAAGADLDLTGFTSDEIDELVSALTGALDSTLDHVTRQGLLAA